MKFIIIYYHQGKNKFTQDEIQNRDSVLYGYWCFYYLNERQKGKSILDVIHNQNFDEDNRDFIISYLKKYNFISKLV